MGSVGEPDAWEVSVFQRTAQHCYRIPAVVRSAGVLLAFAERRHGWRGNPCADHGNIDIVLRESRDEGRTWSDERVVVDHTFFVAGGHAAATNPSPVVVDGEEVKLLFNVSLDRDGDGNQQARVQEGEPSVERLAYIVTLRAGERTRSSAVVDLSAELRDPSWRWFAFGPGHGIVLARGPWAGRVVVPGYFSLGGERPRSHSTVFTYDDTHGWRIGGHTSDENVPGRTSSEAQVAELSDGALILNSRRIVKHPASWRRVAISRDGGASWGPSREERSLQTPISHGSLLATRLGDRDVLVFASPSCQAGHRAEDPLHRFRMRRRMAIHVSDDGGQSWPRHYVLRSGSAGYADLVALGGHRVGVLYEAPIEIEGRPVSERFARGWYENGITFASVPLGLATRHRPLGPCVDPAVDTLSAH